MSTATKTTRDTNAVEIQRIFELQKKNEFVVAATTAKERKAKLNKLHKTLLAYRPEIKEALYNDFRKHPSEVDLTEIYPVTSELKHVKKHLRWWMKPQSVETPFAMLGSSSHIRHEPKGTVLIISPWNFPINLTLCPLISAVAAGNTVMIKPSEGTPHASAVMKKMIQEVFDENEVAIVEGAIETSTSLLKLPFNHIFFTGAPSIGKIVMEAAAKNLSSVTLELGGKSPTIVDETASIETAARRIAWSKFLNNGQICIAPDYVFVHKSKKDAFLTAVKKNIDTFYSEHVASNPSYCRIVNNRHYQRISSYVADAVEKGATLETGGNYDNQEDYISPTVVTNVPEDSLLMQKEIFGPIMPVIEFTDLTEVIDKINAKEKPLALYIYSKSKKNINRILSQTRAGGSCINHCAVHFFNNNLPFGGSNNSGIGKGHGLYGFQAFSNARGVLKQHMPNALELLMPPYTNVKQRLIDLTIKYF